MINRSETALKGIIATPVTPLAADGSVDYATQKRMTRFLVAHRVHGIAVPTHMGESLRLSLDERLQLAQKTVDCVEGSVPVMVHVSATDRRDVIRLASEAERIGAAGILVHPPYHSRITAPALEDYFASILSEVNIPVYGYNSRSEGGYSVPGDLVASLASTWSHFRGIKDISGSIDYLAEVCGFAARVNREFSILVGGEHLVAVLALGGHGAFAGAFAIVPRMIHALYEACVQGNMAVARPLQFQLSSLLQVLSVHYPSRYKIALEIMGRPTGSLRLEVGGEYQSERSVVEQVLKEIGATETEPHGWVTSD